MKDEARVLIAASGSGGHLFPAQFIAKEIRKQFPEVEIAFVGSGRPLEAQLIDGAGFKRHVLSLEGLRSRNLVRFPYALFRAFISTWRLLSEYKPNVIIGVGGYVSFFPVVLGRLRGIPSIIHEAEIRAGKANRILAFFATKITLAFEGAEIPCRRKTIHTGHPLREELSAFETVQESSSQKSSRILVVGGSQGAKGLDESLAALASFLRKKNIEIIHQCRQEHVVMLEEKYTEASLNFQVLPFISDMRKAYEWADVIISRSGAGAVMELGVVGKPSILVPFPFAQGGHQKSNAMVLVKQGKAILCEEGEELSRRLSEAIELVLEPSTYKKMLLAKSDKRSLNATSEIAKLAVDIGRGSLDR